MALQLRLWCRLVHHPVDAVAWQLKHHSLRIIRQLKVDAVAEVWELLQGWGITVGGDKAQRVRAGLC